MPHVQPFAGRVGEHVEHVKLRFCGIDADFIGFVLQPKGLPFFF
jgi:hypothetical protein